MNFRSVEELIIFHEGFRNKPYRCSAGKLTIGFGRNLENKGISISEARMMLKSDIDEAVQDLETVVIPVNSVF